MQGFEVVEKVALLLTDMNCPWFVCGGWAIDLFVGHLTREHKDVDIAVARVDQFEAREHLLDRGWDLKKAIDGKLFQWAEGEKLELPVHTVWCEKKGSDPNFMELLFNEVDDNEFRFRRDTSIRMPIDQMSFRTSLGIPVLAPEIVLLYKSNNPRENESDFKIAVPLLSESRRIWLNAALTKIDPQHTWLAAFR